MKKFIIPVSIILTVGLSMTSCNKPDIKSSKTYTVNGAEESITPIIFKGHEYLIYDGYKSGSMCHSESCDCKTIKSN
jgi:hypothetical protein